MPQMGLAQFELLDLLRDPEWVAADRDFPVEEQQLAVAIPAPETRS